jgi:hypothetical protein
MATSTTTPTFQHGKNAFLALGFDAGLTSGALVQATTTSTTASLTISGSGTGTLLTQNNAMTAVGGGSAVYGVFMGDSTKVNGPVPLYGTALSSTAMTVTSANVPTTAGTYNVTPMVNVSPWLNDISFPQAIEPQETTSFSAAGVKTYIVGLKGYTITFSGHFDGSATASGYAGGIDAIIAAALAWQDSGRFVNFVYGPATPGGFTGLTADMKYYGQGILAKYDLKSGVNNVVTFDGEIQVSGAIYRTTL